MLKSQVIENIWKCDNCKTEQVIEINPFFRITIIAPSNSSMLQIDFCSTCIALIPSQVVADYITNLL